MEKVKTFINLKTIREFLKEESENYSEQQLQDAEKFFSALLNSA